MSWQSILIAITNALQRPFHRRRLVDPFFALSFDLLCVTALDGAIRRVNPAFIATLGYRQQDLLDRNLVDLQHPADCAAAAAIAGLARGIPTPPMETRFRCASGAYTWLAWTCTPFPSAGRAYTVAHDRTNHQLDAESVRQSEALHDGIFESTSDAVFKVDREWRLTRVNHHAERLWMRHREDLLGRGLWELFPEAVDGPFYSLFQEVMSSGVAAHMEEFYPYPPLARWLQVNVYPRPGGLAVYFRDITERRLAAERIERILQEKEVLLREVHHRVKNNLQVICSMLRLQERHFSDDKLLRALRDCRERVMAMAMLHDQLHRAKDFSNINLGEYLKNLTASLFCSYGVNSSDVALRTDVEDIPVTVDTAIPCGLIVNELVSNSLRHAFPDGRKGAIWLGLHAAAGGRIELTVADDGRGFFACAHATRTRSLGLWLVDLLADQIGAVAERSNGDGTRYLFVFQDQIARAQ